MSLELSKAVLARRVFNKPVNDHLRRSTVLAILGGYVSPDRVSVDVGGATGHITCFLADHSKEVVAFEAVPPVWEQLRLMESEYKNVKTHNKAVSDFDGVSKFFVDDKRLSNSGFQDLVGGQEIQVDVVKLDTFFGARQDKIGFIKIDVEGTELDVLHGAERIIDVDKPSLMVEIYEPYTKCELADIFKYLMGKRYGCWYYNPAYGPVEVPDVEAGVEAVKTKHKIHDGDFIFVHRGE